jgi:hypothetical protein
MIARQTEDSLRIELAKFQRWRLPEGDIQCKGVVAFFEIQMHRSFLSDKRHAPEYETIQSRLIVIVVMRWIVLIF